MREKIRLRRWLAASVLLSSIVAGISACGEAPGVPRGGPAGGAAAPSGGPAAASSSAGGEAPKSSEAPQSQETPSTPKKAEPLPSAEGKSGSASPAPASGSGGAAGAAAVAGDVVRIELKDYEFAPADAKVKAKNGEVHFLWENTSTHAHNYRIVDKGGSIVYPGPKVGAKKKREETLKLAPGEYKVFCNLSDHEERGMKGTLIVE